MRSEVFLKKSLYLLSFIVVLLTTIICFYSVDIVYADSNIYSGVLDDLKEDSTFSTRDYPLISDDYSLEVIQIAESVDKELLVYVYQPSGGKGNLTGSSINISETEDLSFKNYKLSLLNSNGVFYKYVVNDFIVSDYSIRYYYISSIFRYFDASIDKQASRGNSISEVSFSVSKQYRFLSEADNYYCDVIEFETISITDKFVGYVRYSDGFKLFSSGACDSHFVAFDTDKPIDSLLEADVYYVQQLYSNNLFSNVEEKYAYLKYTDKVVHTGSGWGAGVHKWDRIESVEQFLSENEIKQKIYTGALLNVSVGTGLSSESEAHLKSNKWVLRFAETSYTSANASGWETKSGTIVGDVTILRLKFEYDGNVYNLGVVDNKQTGSIDPIIDDGKVKVSLTDKGKRLLGILLFILAVVVLLCLCPSLFVYLLNVVLWIVLLPFRLVGLLVKAIKNGPKRNSGEQ